MQTITNFIKGLLGVPSIGSLLLWAQGAIVSAALVAALTGYSVGFVKGYFQGKGKNSSPRRILPFIRFEPSLWAELEPGPDSIPDSGTAID